MADVEAEAIPTLGGERLPDASVLHDQAWHAQLDAHLVPHLDPSPRTRPRVDGREVARILYHLERFQAHWLGPQAPRPANASATDLSERHPTRLPSSTFSRSAALDAAAETPPTVAALVRIAFDLYDQASKPNDLDSLDPTNISFFCHVLAQIRKQVPLPGNDWRVTVFPRASPDTIGQAQAMAQFIDLTYTNDIQHATHILYPNESDLDPTLHMEGAHALNITWLEASVQANEVLDPSEYNLSLPPTLMTYHQKRPAASNDHLLPEPPQRRPRYSTPGMAAETAAEQDEALSLLEATVTSSSPSHAAYLPPRARWFNSQSIHPIERHSLPEWFSGTNRSKTVRLYTKYRSFFVLTYRLNPSDYLTVTAVRKVLAGDVWGLMRIHTFLDRWGIINALVTPDRRPQPLGPAYTGHFRVLLDTPTGLQPWLSSSSSPSSSRLRGLKSLPVPPPSSTNSTPVETQPDDELVLPVRSALYQTRVGSNQSISTSDAQSVLQPFAQGNKKMKQHEQYTCSACGISFDDGDRYVLSAAPTAGPVVSPHCYQLGRFPATFHASDFVLLPSPTSTIWSNTPSSLPSHNDNEGPSGSKGAGLAETEEKDAWTPVETLKLLGATQQYGLNWTQVSKAVGTRSAQDCALQFLQLPIEDRYLGSEPAQAHHETLGALASLVPPKVSRQAARNAIAALDRAVKDRSTGSDGKTHQAVDAAASPVRSSSPPKGHPTGHTMPPIPQALPHVHLRLTDEESATRSEFLHLAQTQLQSYTQRLEHLDAYDARLASDHLVIQGDQRQVLSQRLVLRRQLKQVFASVGLYRQQQAQKVATQQQQQQQPPVHPQTPQLPQSASSQPQPHQPRMQQQWPSLGTPQPPFQQPGPRSDPSSVSQ